MPDDKFIYTHPKPTGYQNELLTQLIEECSEVIQRATKMQRFGVDEVQKDQSLTNAERLSMEYGNLSCVATRARDAGILSFDFLIKGFEEKDAKLKKYLQHSPESIA